MGKLLPGGGAILSLIVMSASSVLAADLPSLKEAPAPAPPPIAGGWVFEATLDGWAPSPIANVGVRRLPTVSSDVGFFTLLRHLNGVVPLTLTAKNENFILGLDLYWSAVSAGAHIPASNTALGPYGGLGANLRLSETFLTGFGGVRLPTQGSDLSVYAIAGARFVDLTATLGLDAAIPGIGVSGSQTKDWADPIVGLAAHYTLNDKWFLTGEADIGGVANSATWQTFAAVGYNWSQSVALTVGFRALYVDYTEAVKQNGSFRLQQTLLGPQLTVSYLF
ncbi:hypothetical protein [Rhodoblastus sp.]|uniref:hypothetical protein n=1 Tax=Rhodoblastus sp. TaxID=1962975 RepID=UPI003F9BD394